MDYRRQDRHDGWRCSLNSGGEFRRCWGCFLGKRHSYCRPGQLHSYRTWGGIVGCFGSLFRWLLHYNFHKTLVPAEVVIREKRSDFFFPIVMLIKVKSCVTWLTVGFMLGIFPLSSVLICEQAFIVIEISRNIWRVFSVVLLRSYLLVHHPTVSMSTKHFPFLLWRLDLELWCLSVLWTRAIAATLIPKPSGLLEQW